MQADGLKLHKPLRCPMGGAVAPTTPSGGVPSGDSTPESSDRFQRVRHARYFQNRILYHVIFRVTQGFYLLNPDRNGERRRVAAGILGRASKTFPSIRRGHRPGDFFCDSRG